MEGLRITKSMLRSVRAAGACRPSMRRNRPGMPIHMASWDDLFWVRDHVPQLAARIERRVGAPIWALGHSGWGFLRIVDSGFGNGYSEEPLRWPDGGGCGLGRKYGGCSLDGSIIVCPQYGSGESFGSGRGKGEVTL